MELTHIFEPITINGLTIKNRMVVSAMASCYCSEDGMPTEKFMAYHERKARGGFGARTSACALKPVLSSVSAGCGTTNR